MKKINKVIFLDTELECDDEKTGNVIEIGLSILDPRTKEIEILPNIAIRHKNMVISDYCRRLLGKDLSYYKTNGLDPITALNTLNKIGLCSKDNLVVSWGNDRSVFDVNGFTCEYDRFFGINASQVKFTDIKNFLDFSTLFRIKWGTSTKDTLSKNISLSEALDMTGLMFEDALKSRHPGTLHEPRDDAYNLAQLFRCTI